MNVSCPNCATVYRVDPAKVPEGGVRARCSICSAVFAVGREAGARAAAAATPTAPPAPTPSMPPPTAAAPAPIPSSPRADQPRSVPPAPMMPAAPPPAHAVPGPASRPTSFPPPAVPAAAPRPAMPPAAPMPPAPAMSRGAAAAPPPPAAPPPAPAPPQAPAPAPVKPTAVTGSRPVNPFLSQDPALKARRLARALISDMVVYHPAKRQEGLRDGNLKQLFDEEIRKSWEEYAEQVGKDVADSTPYFKEALNEILAGGRQIF
ncbi:MAG: zinc-ribbon domain-containing protein [Gemmatimonadales bacterium]